MKMILTVYLIIITYFLIGTIGFIFINRKKDPVRARKSWRKTLIYFIIINIVSISIIINPLPFRFLSIVIILAGFYEIFKLYRDSKYEQSGIFIIAVLIFILLSSGFFLYSGLNKEIIFYAFAILCIFDSFSNITGELWGRRKIMPKISPNKTITGFIGGFIVALISGIFFRKLISAPLLKAILLTAGLAFSAFIGDALSSYYKRIFKVKDFTNIIPEHGGFLDRFDSLIAGGAWTALYTITIF